MLNVRYVSIYGLADPSTQQLRYVGKTEATLERRWRLGRYSPEGRAKILAAQKRRRDRERNAATAAQQGATL